MVPALDTIYPLERATEALERLERARQRRGDHEPDDGEKQDPGEDVESQPEPAPARSLRLSLAIRRRLGGRRGGGVERGSVQAARKAGGPRRTTLRATRAVYEFGTDRAETFQRQQGMIPWNLALLGAIPATILITERLSISRLGTGRTPLRSLQQSRVRTLKLDPSLVTRNGDGGGPSDDQSIADWVEVTLGPAYQ